MRSAVVGALVVVALGCSTGRHAASESASSAATSAPTIERRGPTPRTEAQRPPAPITFDDPPPQWPIVDRIPYPPPERHVSSNEAPAPWRLADDPTDCAQQLFWRDRMVGKFFRSCGTLGVGPYFAFAGATHAWVVTGTIEETELRSTTDGGTTWSMLSRTANLREIHFFDVHRGVGLSACGGFGAPEACAVVRSDDGGATWAPVDIAAGGGFDAQALAVDGDALVVLGSWCADESDESDGCESAPSASVASFDRGDTWTVDPASFVARWLGATMFDDGNGGRWYSLNSPFEPLLYFSSNGQGLSAVVPPVQGRTFVLEAVRGAELWGWSPGTERQPFAHHWYSPDAASSWTAMKYADEHPAPPLPLPDPPGGVMTSLSFIDERIGFAIPSYNWQVRRPGPYLARTRDGGKSWRIVGRLPPETSEVTFVDRRTVDAHAGNARWRSEDAGHSWTRSAPEDGDPVLGAVGDPSAVCPSEYTSGESDRTVAYATDPTGGEWLVCTGESASGNQPKAVLRRSSLGRWHLVAASGGGGAGAPIGRLSTFGYAHSLVAVSPNTAYLHLSFATVARTVDGGLTWDLFDHDCRLPPCGIAGYEDHVWIADGVHLWHAVGDRAPELVG